MSEEWFRLPDNSTTTDVEEYIREWHNLAHPVEKLTGWELHSFDPSLNLADNRTTHEVPLHLAREVANLADERDRLRAERDEMREDLEILVEDWEHDANQQRISGDPMDRYAAFSTASCANSLRRVLLQMDREREVCS